MKTPQKFLALLSGAALLASSALSAQDVSTAPVGYVTVTVSGGSVASPASTFFSLPLTSSSEDTGSLTALSSSTLTNTSASWESGDFAGAAPYFVEITSGDASGSIFKITANDSDTLTLDTLGLDLTALVSVGATYRVFPGDTLRSVLGDDTNNVTGGASPNDDVDVVYILSGTTWNAYYYNTSAGNWRKGAVPVSQDNLALAPHSAIIYSRVGADDIEYVFTGSVPMESYQPVISATGFTSIASYFPVDQTLGSLGLHNLSWWRSVGDPGVTIADADTVYLYSAGFWNAYHYNATAGHWRKGAVPVDQSSAVISVGDGVLISRGDLSGNVEQASVALPY
jgi:uncharacterized protein (TIGR02597 family)